MKEKAYPVRTWKLLDVKWHKKRAAEPFVVEHLTTALIRAPDADEFPIAIEIIAPSVSNAYSDGPEVPVTFRALDGYLYRPMRMRRRPAEEEHWAENNQRFDLLLGMRKDDLLFPEARIAEGFGRDIDQRVWDNPFGPFPVPLAETPAAEAYPDGLREIVTDRVEEADRRTAESAARLAVFDGLLWERTREPVWVVDHRHVRMSVERVWDLPESFRLDRLEEAQAHGREFHGGSISVAGKLKYLDASHLKRNDRCMVAMGIAVRLAATASAPYALMLPIEAVDAMLAVRQAALAQPPIDDDAADRLVDICGVYLEQLERLDLNEFGRKEFVRDVMEHLRIGIHRWKAMGGVLGPAPLSAEDDASIAAIGLS
jgi:hypothetical protein